MATQLRVERNDDWMRRESVSAGRINQMQFYQDALSAIGGRKADFFKLHTLEGVPYFYHMVLPLIVVPRVPGKTDLEVYNPFANYRNLNDVEEGAIRREVTKSVLSRVGYDFSNAQLQGNGFYEIKVLTPEKGDLTKILSDLAPLQFRN